MRLEEKPNALIVYFANGRILDESQIDQIGEQIAGLVDRVPKGKGLILDFAGVVFISSAMIGKLLHLNRASKVANVDLMLRNICPAVQEVFKVTRLNKIFRIGDGNYGEDSLAGSSVKTPNGDE